jgi:FG-GAP-like repeat
VGGGNNGFPDTLFSFYVTNPCCWASIFRLRALARFSLDGVRVKNTLLKTRRSSALCLFLTGLFFSLQVAVSFAQSVSFSAATSFYFPGNLPVSVAVGDFNGDGKLDLAAAGFEGRITILLGTGTGSFDQAGSTHVALDSPNPLAAGDFNGDGKLDLAVGVSTLMPPSRNITILLGAGTGFFSSSNSFAVGVSAESIALAAGDFNGDGKLDLAVTNGSSSNVSVFLGAGTGSFGAATNFAVGVTPRSVAVGDFNGDGKLDLAVANSGSNNVSILLGTGAGSFEAATNFAVGNTPVSVAVGDFNGDGRHDLAVANSNSGNASILLGNGNGTFGVATNFAVGATQRSIAVGDFNGDGKVDLAVTNSGNNVSILLGTGAGSFGAATNFAVGNGAGSLAIGDFNEDGKLDIVTANFGSNDLSLLLNTTSISFTNLVAALLPSSRSVQVGTPATAFATVINAGENTAVGCAISTLTGTPAAFVFQTTDPATNIVTGLPNAPVDIPAGSSQSFVFALTPTAPIAPTDVQLSFDCANTFPASILSGINTLFLSASVTPVPDIVALAATPSNDGIVTLASTGVFAVATVNMGASENITVSADTGAATLPVNISLCETNPATGACISAIGPSVTTQINANATPTFGIFVEGSGAVPFDPAANRIFVRFKDGGEVTRGSTSVAVRTH